MFTSMLLSIALLYVVIKVFSGKRINSMDYRKLLTNLYVAGKVREIAKKNGIDLTEEYIEFNKLFQTRKQIKDIDNVIEEKLNTQIQEPEVKTK